MESSLRCPMRRNASSPRDWQEGCAAMIRHLGSAAFEPLFIAQLRRLCPVEDLVITAYFQTARSRASVPPKVLYYALDSDQIDVCVTQYEKGAYRLDPFYQACVEARPAGVYRLLDLAPDDFRRTAYYRDYYKRVRPLDEIGLLARLDDDIVLIASIGLTPQAAATRRRQIELLRAAFPLLAALMERQWGPAAKASVRHRRPKKAKSGAHFGAPLLSPREAEVVDFVLLGHSSQAISQRLSIAEATVKIHRKNAYAKLGLSSQAELFARYLDFALGDRR